MRSRLSEMSVEAVGNYALALDEREYAKMKQDGPRKRQARRLGEVLSIGNWLYTSVRLIQNNWRNEVLSGETAYDRNEEASIQAMFRQWLQPTERCLQEIAQLEAAHQKVPHSKTFRRHCEAAREILTGRDAFFDDLQKAWRWFALTGRHRETPRAVRIDEAGRVFETTGERYVPPGLTPEDLVGIFSPCDETQAKPLKDIVAGRADNGI